MSENTLNSIGVRVEGGLADTGNALPVMHEVLHALRRLDSQAESTTIDLRAIPFGPGDEQRLLDMLGSGEIRATIDSLGRTDIRETRFHGAWIVDHYDVAGTRIGLQVEITDCPALIQTPKEDISEAVAALESVLATAGTSPSQEATQ